jgi:hypothetical protein
MAHIADLARRFQRLDREARLRDTQGDNFNKRAGKEASRAHSEANRVREEALDAARKLAAAVLEHEHA